MSRAARQISVQTVPRKPRLGFVGLGWIGRNRLQSVVEAGLAEITALHDVQASAVEEAQKLLGNAAQFSEFEELLNHDLDGVVIATPNCFHADQSIAALERGIADILVSISHCRTYATAYAMALSRGSVVPSPAPQA